MLTRVEPLWSRSKSCKMRVGFFHVQNRTKAYSAGRRGTYKPKDALFGIVAEVLCSQVGPFHAGSGRTLLFARTGPRMPRMWPNGVIWLQGGHVWLNRSLKDVASFRAFVPLGRASNLLHIPQFSAKACNKYPVKFVSSSYNIFHFGLPNIQVCRL